MKWNYSTGQDINLFVQGKIRKEDADRQYETARVIVNRLRNQPGIILADEVGMGKTFVALTVAFSVALSDEEQRPIVIMIPSSIEEKWKRDCDVFKEKCLPVQVGKGLRASSASSTIEFLKLLDDPKERRNHIIFLTHNALLKSSLDSWVKLAFIQRALRGRRNTNELYKILNKYLAEILYLRKAKKKQLDIVKKLLDKNPEDWKKILVKAGILDKLEDDPIPFQIIEALRKIPTSDFDSLYHLLRDEMPRRDSQNIKDKMKNMYRKISDAQKSLWRRCISELTHSLPLLILDEAHHLKNSKTQIAKLFQRDEENNSFGTGQFKGVFERMLFLTATPFQLGHHELCNVLDIFKGINWDKAKDDNLSLEKYENDIDNMRKVLDRTQECAVRFDQAWESLNQNDLELHGQFNEDPEKWWEMISQAQSDCLSEKLKQLTGRFELLRLRMKESEEVLKKYVIRHQRAKEIVSQNVITNRRSTLPGSGILDEESNGGIKIQNNSLLPFLLASRLSSLNPQKRPVFAEGLASSFEAFLFTRDKDKYQDLTDIDDEKPAEILETDIQGEWYLSQIKDAISQSNNGNEHPKVMATVSKVLDLWSKGEKVLLFCHYIATGKVLSLYISNQMISVINSRAARQLGCSEKDAEDELERIGDYFDVGRKMRSYFDRRISEIIQSYPQIAYEQATIMDVILRYFRTPSFLVRFFPLGEKGDEESLLEKAFQQVDGSGLTLESLIKQFLSFLSDKCSEKERISYLRALESIQTGMIRTKTTNRYADGLDEDTIMNRILPNVRLVTGATKQETRQNIMLTFNTPFYPDILVATSVMAEGVDLHLNCRHIIHHDLCWNPSTLEQRTGRIDRIGAKVEQCEKPINVFLPYVSETQDEKMYKVVMDRERWFNILMGEKYKEDLNSTEIIAERVPLPMSIVNKLSFKLHVWEKGAGKEQCLTPSQRGE